MRDTLTYKDYRGCVHYNDEEEIFYGKLEGIRSLVSFEGRDVSSLKAAFQESVDDYLETCRLQGQEPEKPYRGSFNVRVGTTLHRQAVERSALLGRSLNDYIKDLLKKNLDSENRF